MSSLPAQSPIWLFYLNIVLPLCRMDGTFIALKGANAEEELNEAKNAILFLEVK